MTSLNIERLIAECDFSDYEKDSGTGGFCAMFALALYRTIINQNPSLILACENQFYDIEGRQQPEWIIDNYLWGIPVEGYNGKLLDFAPEEFLNEVKKTPSAIDWRFYSLCEKRLALAKSKIG